MANQRETRYTRVEDAEGNVYKFDASGAGGGGGVGGEIVDDEDIGTADSGSINTTDGAHTSDSEGNNGTVIIISSGATDKNAATILFDGLTFGMYSIGIRAKSSVANNTTEILKVNTYYVDNTGVNPQKLTGSHIIRADQFASTNVFTEIGISSIFEGIYTTSLSFKVEIILLKNTNTTLTLDNISVYKVAMFDYELNNWSINAPQTRTVYQLQTRVKTLEDNVLRKANIVNNTSSSSTSDVLSANMGRQLAVNISNLQTSITNLSNSYNAHSHPANKITAGTLAGRVIANASAVATLGNKQVRNIHAGTGGISSLPTGDIYIQYS